MPLPDERPRQSVANLIGRFENQVKRQPPSAQTPSRSTSVVSHTTGDSAKEEVKEKREWPPRPVTEATPTPPVPPPTSFRFKSPAPQPTPSTSSEPPVSGEPTTNGSSKPNVEVPKIPSDPAPAQLEPEAKTPAPPRSQPSKLRTPSKAPTTSPNTRTPPTAPKATARTPSTGKTPAKSPAPSSPPAQALKPQHTGQSVSSNTAKKAAITKGTTTPSRPKTPSRTTVTPSRSSNLYAPTAASLARARSAPSPVPTPPKKAAASGASERLSKPTAASLSRTRTPVASPPTKPVALPARTATTPKPTTRGTNTSARGTGRGNVPSTPPKVVKNAEGGSPSGSPEIAIVDADAATTGTTVTAPPDADQDIFSTKETTKEELEQQVDVSPTLPKPDAGPEKSAGEDHLDDSTVIQAEVKVVISDEEGGTIHDEALVVPQSETQPVPVPSQEDHVDGSSPAEEASHEEAEEHITDPIADKLAALASKHNGTDIEQIVNLLETGPSTSSASDTLSTPSEMSEIPDEEH